MRFPARSYLLLALWSCALPAMANDTAINAGAHGPAPLGEFQGEESVIRMVSESVDVVFGKKSSHVKCRFVFRSEKKEGAAKQIVGFPDFLIDEGDGGTIGSLKTKVNGKEILAEKKRGWFTTEEWGMPKSGLGSKPPKEFERATLADFYCIEVAFPAGEEVVIEREYEATNGGSVEGDVTFNYSTLTGAVWRGAIGSAEFRVKLEGWTVDDLAFEDGAQKIPPLRQRLYSSPNLKEWTVVSATELKMSWKDFEPSVHSTRRGLCLRTWVRRTNE